MSFKSTIKNTFLLLGGDAILRKLNRTPRILFWHGVDEILDQKVEAESFDLFNFKRQIAYLNKYYEIISLDEFHKRFKQNKFTNKEVVLTFDDGYLNNLTIVSPILNKLNLPFTVFISTEHITTGELYPTSIARLIFYGSGINEINVPSINIFNKDISDANHRERVFNKVITALKNKSLAVVRKIISDLKANLSVEDYKKLVEKYKSVKPMNWDEVKKLHSLGATIGSHCKYHICCHENQDKAEVKRQIEESKQVIEQNLKTSCDYFAYPNGNYTNFSNSIVKKANYKMGFSTEKAIKISNGNDIAIIPRIGVPLNLNTFKIIINLYPKK